MSKVLLLGYGLGQPSFRHRMQSLVQPLEAAGWQVRTEQFPSGRYGLRTWERRALLRWADVVVLHQIKLSAVEARLLASLSRRRVFDVDDAIYVRKPRRLGEPVDTSLWRLRKFHATCRWADVVAAGNEVLANVARRTARHIEVLPTSIDTSLYRAGTATDAKATTRAGTATDAKAATRVNAATEGISATEPGPPTEASAQTIIIAWIGSPENLIYLELIRPALARLAARYPALRLRVICSEFPDWPEVRIERVTWSADTEARALAAAHIGIMPLTDDEWSRGKCAFKLLQYMAASLPCVASPVGANIDAVLDGRTGFHARDDDAWEHALSRLIDDPELRARFGARGFEHVEERYGMRAYRAHYAALLNRLAAR